MLLAGFRFHILMADALQTPLGTVEIQEARECGSHHAYAGDALAGKAGNGHSLPGRGQARIQNQPYKTF